MITDELNKIIYRYARSFTSDETLIEDLYQQGVIGVLKAKKNYNMNQGTDFNVYAKMYIYGEMHDYFNRLNKTFKTSKETIKLYTLIKKTSELLTQEYKRNPTVTEISNYTGVKEEDILNTLKIMTSTLSLDYDYEETKLENFIGYDEKYTSIELNEIMENLSDNEKKIIAYKYLEGYTQEEIAKMMNISQSSVSRYEHDGISRIRRKHGNS